MLAALRLAGMFLLLVFCLPAHFLARLLTGRSRWPRRFLAGCGWLVGARVSRIGTLPGPHSLLLSNHVSWVDILVLANATGARFVAKDDLGHPVMIWLADLNATIYVRRSDKRGSRDQALTIAKALEGVQPVAIFPEGTTGPGNGLLPFRSTLLEAASLVERPIEIRPVAVDYGAATPDVRWHDEGGLANALRLLGRRGVIRATVNVLPAIGPANDRKRLAQLAHDSVEAALAASSSRAAGL